MQGDGGAQRVLYARNGVKEMRKRGDGTWPEAFQEVESTRGACPLRDLVRALDEEEEEETRRRAAGRLEAARTGARLADDDSDGDSSLPPLVENRNRRKVQTYVDSDESDSE